MSDSDLLFGADDTEDEIVSEASAERHHVWRVLIVDDEDQVHKVTALVLGQCDFDNSPIELVHAYSMKEASEIMESQEPFALALVDVVMETDDAGLRLVQYIRETLNDNDVRIVLRTGQPGQAPEETVISKYDINDYKNKTELTSTKLKTLLYSALRSYRDIRTIAANRKGLFNLIDATSKILDTDKLPIFASAVLEEIGTLLNLDTDAVVTHTPVDALAAKADNTQYAILAATGSVRDIIEQQHELPQEITHYFDIAKQQHAGLHEEKVYVGYYQTDVVGENLLYVKPNVPLDRLGTHLLDIYTRCVAITHNNLQHKDAIQKSRQEMVYVLSETIEKRVPGESNHVRRVSKMAHCLATAAGLDKNTCERIKLAAPLHDIGTIGIPDDVLTKQAVYTDEDREIMSHHTEIGATILGKSERPILKLASQIAAQHHERWDGKGHPKNLSGEEIHIAARIVSVVDVIDALGCHKPYRAAFKDDEIEAFLKKESGQMFDPSLAEHALNLMDEFKKIRLAHPDQPHS